MKIIYENCGVKNSMKEEHSSYTHNFFFRFSFRNCKGCVYNCDDLLSYNFSNRNSHRWFSYVHNFIIILSRVCNEPIQRPARIWLVGSVGKSAAPVLQRSRVRIPYTPEFFSGFHFATAKVASITAMNFSHITPNIVGCYMLHPFARPVECCCVLMGVVAQSLEHTY